MRSKTFTVTASAGGVTYSPAFTVDTYGNPCNIGIGVVVTGSALYDVQHTFSDPWSTNLSISSNGTWLNNEILTSAATSDDTNYAFPPRAIRLAMRAAASATGTITIQQAGPE